MKGILPAAQPPGPLFHYTTLEALLKILESGKMWASDLGFVNDPSELAYGLALVKKRVAERRKQSPGDGESTVLDVLEQAAEIRAIQDTAGDSRFFAFSLTGNGDLLSQWRGYAPKGDGASLSFLAVDLIAAAEAQNYLLVECRYSQEQQNDLIDRLVDQARQAAIEAPQDDLERGLWNDLIMPGLLAILPMLKHEAFKEEKEWRAVFGPWALSFPDTMFRARDRRIIPYLEFELPRDPDDENRLAVEHVVIGPGPHQELSAMAVRGLLQRIAGKRAKLALSQIPFR
jgi:hypothetical protein